MDLTLENITIWNAVIGTVIAFSALIATAISVWTRLRPIIKEKKDRRALIDAFGQGPFDKETIEKSTRYFIRSKCSNIDPAREVEIRHALAATQHDLFIMVDKFIFQENPIHHLLLLADSGMGKTTFVLNYYARHVRKRRRDKIKLAIVPLGHKDADQYIAKIPEDDRKDTVIFLDALDEDIGAISGYLERLSALMDACCKFRRMIITCRTQFFKRDEEIPVDTGIARIELNGSWTDSHYEFRKIYLSPFDDSDVSRFLKKRYPFWRFSDRKKAFEIVKKIPNLKVRPMLLSYIPDIISDGRQISKAYQLYDSMIDAWFDREEGWVNKENLKEFSERMAMNLFVNREKRGMEKASHNEISRLAEQWNIPLESWQLTGRSLLNRDVEGNFKFAHQSILYYLFVKKFIELDMDARPRISWNTEMKKFLIEMIETTEKALNLQVVDLSKIDIGKIDFKKSNLWGANFEGSNLKEANFEESELGKTNFKNVNLSNAILIRADLSGSNLKGANLLGADFENANFEEANIDQIIFTKTNLVGADFNKNSLSLEYAINFFKKAGFTIFEINYELGVFLIKTSEWPSHSHYGDIIVRVFNGDLEGYKLQKIEKIINKKNVSNKISYALYDREMRADAFFQIAAYKSGKGLTIIPINTKIIRKILLYNKKKCYMELISLEKKYLGNKNPYNLNNSIKDPNLFFGRFHESDDIIKRLESLQHSGIFGMRKIGKTSLLLQIELALKDKLIPTAVIKSQAGISFNPYDIFKDIVNQIYIFVKASGIKKKPRCKILENNTEKITHKMFEDDIITLWEIVRVELNSPFIAVLIDEVEKLVPLPGDDITKYEDYDIFFSAIRGLSQIERCLVSVVTSERPIIREEFNLPSVSNAMLELYDERFLGCFEYNDCKMMTENLGKLIGIEYSKESIKKIFYETNGHPYITNKVRLCERSEPQSEPFVGQARSYYIENIFLGYDGQIRRVGDRGSSASQKMIFEIDFFGKAICQRQKILFFERRYSLPIESVFFNAQ